MAEFFISYSRADKLAADPLVDRLKSIFGSDNFWIDTSNMRTGDRWRSQIEKAIIDCTFFIYLLSPNSIKSRICKWELKLANQQGKVIFPVKLLSFNNSDLPKNINSLHYTDLSSDINYIKEFDSLLFSIISKRDENRERQRSFQIPKDSNLSAISRKDAHQINFNALFYGKPGERIRAIRKLSIDGEDEVRAWIDNQEELEHYRKLFPEEKSAILPDEHPKAEPRPPSISCLIGLLFDEDTTIADRSLSVIQDWNVVTYMPSLLGSVTASAAATMSDRFHRQVVEFIDQAVSDIADLEKYRNVLNILGGEIGVDVVSEFDRRIADRNRTLKAAEVEEKARNINLFLHQQLYDLILDYTVEPKTEYFNELEKRFAELEFNAPTLQLYKQLFLMLGLDDDMIQLIDSFIDDSP